MKTFLIFSASIIVFLVILWLSGPRVVKTAWLILKVSPYEQTAQGAPTILILGDSTGYGTGARKTSESIAGLIGADFPNYSIENNSENGRTIGELLPVAEKVTGDYELILLQIGGNDILGKRDINEVEKELRSIIDALSDNTKQIVMISTGNVGGAAAFNESEASEYEAITRTYRDMFMRASSETDLTYVDLFVEPEADLFIKDPKKYLSVDGLHPSSAGYGLWYEKLKPVLHVKLSED